MVLSNHRRVESSLDICSRRRTRCTVTTALMGRQYTTPTACCSQHCLLLEQTSGSWAGAWMKRATVQVIGPGRLGYILVVSNHRLSLQFVGIEVFILVLWKRLRLHHHVSTMLLMPIGVAITSKWTPERHVDYTVAPWALDKDESLKPPAYSVSQRKKQDTKLSSLTSANVDRCSNLFHRQAFKETVHGNVVATSTSP